MQLPQGTVIDRYTVDAVLGEGGMAVVYRVRHNQLGSLHAMKVLKLPAAAIQERLLQEGRVQAQLKHPNIVSVTDVVDVNGAPGLVMEFIGGASLDHFLRDRRLTLEQADDLGRGIIEGVAVAHQAGLIHRDLKPANILLGTTPSGVIPKITDFGLAKLLDEEEGEGGYLATRSGMSMGTPAYMAPEQIESAKGVDRRADVFSLGVILYELVSGQRPFQGDSMLAVLNAVAAGRRAPLEEFVPDLPPHYLAAIAGALQVDREARVPNCDALLDLWTGQTRDARGGFSGIWDSTTVDRISRTLVPPSVTSLTDNSETYFPTQGVAAASFVPTSLPPADAMETLSSPVAPPSRRPRLRLGAGVGVVALLSVGGLFATTASGPSPSAPPVPLVTMEPVLPGPSEVVLSEPSPEQTHPKSPTPEPSAPSPSPVGPKPGPVAPGSLVPVEEEQPTPVEEEDPDAPLVTFLSDPDGAQVFLDGLQVGTTPLARFAVPKGRHKVRLELGAASVEEKISVNKRSARTYHWTQATNAWSER